MAFPLAKCSKIKVTNVGISQALQRLGLSVLTAVALDSMPSWGTKISQATWCGQNKTKICAGVTVQFSHSVGSDSLRSHGLQHGRLPCPSATPGAYSNSCPSSRWCHPTISSSIVPFSRLQSFPASGSFPMSQFFASGAQSIGFSASGSVLPMNIQGWFPLGSTGWISLQSKGLSRVLSTPQFKSTLTSIHDYWKNHSFD